jgi:hypothetical protein
MATWGIKPKRRSINVNSTRRSAAFFPILLAAGAISVAPSTSAQALDLREEGPPEIEKCQTISQSGSYKLVNNLTFTGSSGACLTITASSVTIDLAGFTISGPVSGFTRGTGILASGDLRGIAVQNGSLSGFGNGIDLRSATGSLVEKLRVFNSGTSANTAGIIASGIVRNNAVFDNTGIGISATGTVSGNYATGNQTGMSIGQLVGTIPIGGSTVIDNTSTDNRLFGFFVICPSNVTDNTSVNNLDGNLVLETSRGSCNTTNNVAP